MGKNRKKNEKNLSDLKPQLDDKLKLTDSCQYFIPNEFLQTEKSEDEFENDLEVESYRIDTLVFILKSKVHWFTRHC